MAKVKPDEIGKVISKIVDDYSTETKRKVEEVAKRVADDCVKQLKQKNGGGKWKRYPKGWEVKKLPANRLGSVTFVIWNKKYYYLAHLLEKGYHLRNGGWYTGTPHIKPVEEWAKKEYEKMITKELGGK